MEHTEKLKEGVQHLKDEASHLGEKARSGMNYLRDRTQIYQEGASEFLDSMSTYIKENPQRSAMIAGLTGLSLGVVLGLLLRGGRR